METPNLDRVFREYGNDATPSTWRAAGRELVAYRVQVRRNMADRLRREAAKRRALCAEHAIPADAPFLRAILRDNLDRLRRDAPPSGNLSRMVAERASLRRALAAPRRNMDWAPCGLQDAEASRIWEMETLARLLTFAIAAARRETRKG